MDGNISPARLLEISGLTLSFSSGNSSAPVVRDLSLQLSKGEALGIAGESGSGKTLTALSVLGLLPPGCTITKGSIMFYPSPGKMIDLAKANEKTMCRLRGKEIAMVFQEPMTSLNPTMTCGAQVAEVLRVHEKINTRDTRSRVIDLFREVKLPRPDTMVHSYPHELSGGQRQRVMIAMAMATHPSLLIADEPTTALDVTVQKSILGTLKDLKKKYGMGLIFITHDLDIIRELATSVVIMRHGRVVESGSISTIFSHPSSPYTKGLMACKPPLDTRPVKLPSVNESDQQKEQVFHSEDPEERRQKHNRIYSVEPILEAYHVNVTFAKNRLFKIRPAETVQAVNEISFEVYPGETLGIVGESGCGKTTLGRALLRLLVTSGGEIKYRGRLITTFRPSELRHFRQKVQLIFQDPFSSLNPRITAGEALMEPLRVHRILGSDKERREHILRLFEKVRLERDHLNRFPHEFSGGQRQRIAIARALIMNPEIVVCDEPVSSLDVSVQADILNLLNELKEDFALTYLFISHDLSVVKYMSDRVMVLKEGRMVEINEADQLYLHPSNAYTQALLEAIPGIQISKK